MVKRMLLMVAVVAAVTVAVVPEANAGVFVRRVAPVRRVAARVALPPYPIARRAVVGPVYRPYAYRAYSPVIYGGPMYYGPGVMVGVGY